MCSYLIETVICMRFVETKFMWSADGPQGGILNKTMHKEMGLNVQNFRKFIISMLVFVSTCKQCISSKFLKWRIS